MTTLKKHWKNTNSVLKGFFETKEATIALELLQNSKKNPIYFGAIADYITTEYYYENTFSWSDWTPCLWETLHKQSHYFLQKAPTESSICSNATHKSALQFLALFNTTGDSHILTNYLQSSHYVFAEKELQDLFLWSLTRILQHGKTIPPPQLINWLSGNFNCDWFEDYRSKIIGLIGHYSEDILYWTKENFSFLSKIEQENILIGAISLEKETMFYTLVFNNIPIYEQHIPVYKTANSYISLYAIYADTKLYIKTLEQLPAYPAEKSLLSLVSIHRDYNLIHKKTFFKEIILHSTIAIQAKISLFLKLLKHPKSYSYFITQSVYKEFIAILQQKLKESQERILPEQYDIEKGLEGIQQYIFQQSTTISPKWYNKWISV